MSQSMQQATSGTATGIIDYINCRPECTIFRKDYCRITAFALEPQLQPFVSGQVAWGNKHQINVNRAADLLENLAIHLVGKALYSGTPTSLDNAPYYVDYAAVVAMERITLKIGTCLVDEWDSFSLNAWNQQTNKSALDAYAELVGGRPSWYAHDAAGDAAWKLERQTRAGKDQDWWVMIPLYAFAHNELALPTVSLMYNDIVMTVALRAAADMAWQAADEAAFNTAGGTSIWPPAAPDMQILGNYVFLDQVERRLFGRNINEYLGEATQALPPYQVTAGNRSALVPLFFNYPTVAITIVCEDTQTTNKEILSDTISGFGPTQDESFTSVSLRIHGQPRIEHIPASYYRRVVPWRHMGNNRYLHRMYTIPFATKIHELFQPCGALHFGQTDSAHLEFIWEGGAPANCMIRAYARHKNVFRTQLGVGGWKYGACL